MNALKAALIRALLWLSSLLPLSWARSMGRGFAFLYWPIGDRSRKITERNIQLAFPELSLAQQQQLAKDSLAATAETMAEMGRVWMRPWEQFSELILSVEGSELISDAQKAGRGVIAMAPHLGNWEVIGLYTASWCNMVSLYEPPKLAAVGPIIEKARERSGATLVPTDSRGLATLLKSVKRGAVSGILPDQAPPELKAGQNAPFMGVSCFTGTLSVNMIRRTGALAVFAYAKRVPGGFTLHYRLADEKIYDEDTAVALAALNKGVEDCVRDCPEQYQWEYKRFRVRPRQGPGVYDDL